MSDGLAVFESYSDAIWNRKQVSHKLQILRISASLTFCTSYTYSLLKLHNMHYNLNAVN